MLYPLKFKPVYKDYLWGGRNLLKLGKALPEGIVAESWEVSCHSDGESIISNGQFKDMLLSDFINNFRYKVMGTDISWKPGDRFPILVKLIDANNKLSVQVHPDDEYAAVHEDDKSGKNEMWYVIWAKPGSKLVYGLKPNTTKEKFEKAIEKGCIEDFLNYIEVSEGDIINIPAGAIHAIGEGIVLAEVQQNSNNTYRVYDYDRIDKDGKKRPLHIKKALDVIDFHNKTAYGKSRGVSVSVNDDCKVTKLVENNYFSTELHHINGEVEENADGKRFYIYLFIEGKAIVSYGVSDCINDNKCFSEKMGVKAGESIFIPASMGKYRISGNIRAIKIYV